MSMNNNAPKKQKFGPPMARGISPAEKAKDFKGTLKKTLNYMRKDIIAIILAFVFAIGGVVATLLVPDILGGATDKLMSGAMQKTVFKQVAPLAKQVEETCTPEFHKSLTDQGIAVWNLSLGNLVNMANDGDESLTPEMIKMILSMPKSMYTVPLDSLFELKEINTIGELVEKLNLGSTLDKIPSAYHAEVANMSFRVAPQMDIDGIVNILIKIIIIVAISGVLAYIQGYVLAGVGQKISYRFRDDINKKMHKLPLKTYDGMTNGEIMSLITNDVDTISTSLNQSLAQIITSITTVVGVLVMMLRINIVLTLIALISLPINLVCVMLIVKKSQKYFIRQQQYLGRVNGHIEEKFAGHNVVKLFNGEEKSIEEFEVFNKELYESAKNSQFFSGLMQPLSMLVGNMGFAVVCIVGGAQVIAGRISIGSIQAFVQYIKQFNQPITQVASIANTFQSTVAAAERVFEFLELGDEKETGDSELASVKGEVKFENVHFGYNEDKIIIKDFNCNVAQGQRVAIVGPTGAGKTTIVKLLMRFYDLNSGKIYIDGKDIAELKRENLRKYVGMVLQDTWLFNGTIMENIRYGRLDATDEEVIEAAKIACADHFITTLPHGYNFVVNAEAGNISQGQKQLITIARAILADPRILILDEATSSVDTRTESLIQTAMEKLMQGRTSFIIAHRLSTIKNADVILVLKDGDVVEQGTHDELLALDGFYATLYNSQFDD